VKNEKLQGRIVVQLLPQLRNLRQRGLAGWAILIGAAIVAAMAIMTVASPWIRPYDPILINVGPILSPPSAQFPLGTNHLGQDMLSRVYSGGAIMFQVAVLSVIVCLVVGVPIGLFASYLGGYTDKVASLVMDSIYAFPGLVLAIAIAAMLGPGVVNMALSIAVVYVPSYFRIIRSQVLTIKELPYVEAATIMGAKSRTTLFRYILPNVIPSIVAVATINFADAVLTSAGLTFVGLGLPVSTPDWGWDLTYGRRLLPSGAWWVITFPGLMVVLLALGFTMMGEGLSELFNPRLQK
jgi:peptide/nickel transport system permease protein